MNPNPLNTLALAAHSRIEAVKRAYKPTASGAVKRDAFAAFAAIKRCPNWGPKSVVEKRKQEIRNSASSGNGWFPAPPPPPPLTELEPETVTECDCGLARASDLEPLHWVFCTKCQISVSQGIHARCKCGQLQPKPAFDVEEWAFESTIDWIDCDGCGLSSHVSCYPGCERKEKFICLECEYNTELVYTCTKCGHECRDEAAFARHAFQHGDREPVSYSVRDVGEE